MNRLVCVGFGYCARELAARLRDENWQIAGTSRCQDGADEITQSGTEGLVFDGTAPSSELSSTLHRATHLLVSAAPNDAGDPLLRCHTEDILAASNFNWIGYLSTIGVYGDQGNAWIDELTPVRPRSERAKRRVQAENAWLHLGEHKGARVQVFRLAGIYGPGRSVVEKLKAGTARRIVKPGHVFNRIHVADVANVLIAAIRNNAGHTLYNVTDDEPAPPQDVIAYAADLMGVAPPPEIPFEEAELSQMGRSFYMDQRRVANARIKRDLGVELCYSTYRDGLKAVLGF